MEAFETVNIENIPLVDIRNELQGAGESHVGVNQAFDTSPYFPNNNEVATLTVSELKTRNIPIGFKA